MVQEKKRKKTKVMNFLNPDLITIILLAVSILSVTGVVLVFVWVYKKGPLSRRMERISDFVAPSIEDGQAAATLPSLSLPNMDTSKFREWINEKLGSISSEKLQMKISGAYWPITDTEFILIRIFSTALVLFLGWLISGNILGGFLLAIIAILLPNILLDRAISQRQKKFHNQLLDVLVMIKGAVQAGYSLMQSLDLAIKEIPAPASEEFGRLLQETRLGISLENALTNLSERMENDDLQIVVTAIIINSQVGGNLSTVLEATIATIRDRVRLMGEVRSLTSYSRFVGNLLTLMPFVLAAVIFLMSPDYFSTLKTSPITQIIFGAAFMGIVIGNIWIRRTMKIRV